ncbi:MAG TPA: alpha/beta hydrolase, partial [Anaerolineae bacterium]|nr:alpha/beta hydrolase [Anaerolineae bacterium]
PKVALNNGVKTEHLSHDPAIVQAYDADPLVHHVGTIRLAAEVDIVRAELLNRAGEWKLPLLMLHGGDDRLCLLSGAQLLYARLDHSLVEFRQYVGMYHEVHNEVGKEAVFKDVEAWLHRVAE